MAEIQSQVEEMLFKMSALAGTANLPKKPPMETSDSDCTYNADSDNKDDYQVCLKKSPELTKRSIDQKSGS